MDKSKVNFSKPMLIQSVAFKEVFLRMGMGRELAQPVVPVQVK